MSTIKRLEKFTTTRPPLEASPELRNWLQQELERIELIGNGALEAIDELRSAPTMVLGGDADDLLSLGTPQQKVVNYTLSGFLGDVPIEPDPASGDITISIAGIYRVTLYFYGLQPSNTQNETMRLYVDVNGLRGVVSAFDIATNRTQDRTFAATLTRQLSAGDVLSMWMDATGAIGDILVQGTSLEATIIQSN